MNLMTVMMPHERVNAVDSNVWKVHLTLDSGTTKLIAKYECLLMIVSLYLILRVMSALILISLRDR